MNVAIDCYLYDEREAEASELIPKYLELANTAYGDEPTGHAGATVTARRAELGVVLWLARGSRSGLQLFEESLDWFRRQPPPNDALSASCLMNIGANLLQLERWREAVEILELLRDAMIRIPVPPTELAKCCTNLCFAYQYVNRLSDAEAAGRESVRLHKEHTGPKSREVAKALSNLAETLVKLGRMEEARQAAMEGMKLSQYDEEIAGCMLDTLAIVYEAEGKLIEAFQVRERALTLVASQHKGARVKEFGEKQIALLEKLGRLDEASHYRHALEQVGRVEFVRHAAQEGTVN